jgi:hypothetical protein
MHSDLRAVFTGVRVRASDHEGRRSPTKLTKPRSGIAVALVAGTLSMASAA